jgi:magnesium transporter
LPFSGSQVRHNGVMPSPDLERELARELTESHPLETARVLERLGPEACWAFLAELPTEQRAAIAEGFTPAYGARVLQQADPEALTAILRDLPSEVTADMLEYLAPEQRESWLEALPQSHAREIAELSDYPEGSAGSVMSPEFVALREEATVADALTRLRRLALVGRGVNYVYVTGEDGTLAGVLVMRDLALAPATRRLRDIMVRNVFRVYTTDDLDAVADLLLEKGLLAAPVVDDGERLRGVIFATQLVSELQEEGFEDAQKMFGAGSDEHASSSAGFAIKKRLPWMSVNLGTAFLAAAVVGAFEGVIAQLTILAAFLPVVAGQGGNAGAQSLAVMLRSLALGEVDARAPRRVLAKEALVGFVNGLGTGVVAGLIAAVVSGNWALGAVIALAMTGNLVVAGVAGAAIPVVMERLGQDPAQSSNIILTTITDVVGFASFLGLALLARPWLLASG